MPGLHGAHALLLTRGAQRRLPVIELDGQRIGDSTRIIAALEEYRPGPPLYPAEGGQRERAPALEDFFAEHLGPGVRMLLRHLSLPDTDATVAALFPQPAPPR